MNANLDFCRGPCDTPSSHCGSLIKKCVLSPDHQGRHICGSCRIDMEQREARIAYQNQQRLNQLRADLITLGVLDD